MNYIQIELEITQICQHKTLKERINFIKLNFIPNIIIINYKLIQVKIRKNIKLNFKLFNIFFNCQS
jgi:hypothetical protein